MQTEFQNIFNNQTFKKAWDIISAKNSKHGIDNVTIAEFKAEYQKNIQEITEQLSQNKYIPEPYQKILIAKQNGGFRPIALLTLKDKLIQIVVNNEISDKIDKTFCNTSYAYRKEKGHGKAIRRVKDFLARGFNFIGTADIDNFFDTIDRKILTEKLKDYIDSQLITNLVTMWVETGVFYKEKYINKNVGIAQGGVISPLLSNIYLDDFDKTLQKENIPNVRYADNIVIFANSKEKVQENLIFIQDYLKTKLKLKLNDNPKPVVEYSEGFTFCGIHFVDGKCIIDKSKFDKMKVKISNIISNNSLTTLPNLIKDHFEGIKRYYLNFDTEEQLSELAEHFIQKILERYQIEKGKISLSKLKEIVNQINFKEILPKKTNSYFIDIINKSLNFNQITEKTTNTIRKKIEVNSRKYKKIWYQSANVIISTPNSTIGKSKNTLVIRANGKILNQIVTDKIQNLIIAAKGVTISSDIVEVLSEKKIRVDYFDSLGKPFASIISSATPISENTNKQIKFLQEGKTQQLIKTLIISKIKNQISVLRYFYKSRKNSLNTDIWNSELKNLEKYISNIEELTEEKEIDDFRNKIMGYEGIAATSYWKLFSTLIPEEYNFKEREHKSAQNTINIMLNYGYGILYTRLLTSITLQGLNPNLGFLHKEQNGKPVLVFDLIENFRAPVVDRTIIAFISKAGKLNLKENNFPDELKSKISKKIIMRLEADFYYRNELTSLNKEILNQAKNLRKFISNEIKTFKPFLAKW